MSSLSNLSVPASTRSLAERQARKCDESDLNQPVKGIRCKLLGGYRVLLVQYGDVERKGVRHIHSWDVFGSMLCVNIAGIDIRADWVL